MLHLHHSGAHACTHAESRMLHVANTIETDGLRRTRSPCSSTGTRLRRTVQKDFTGACDCQVASWGGYSFIINLLPIHCLASIFTGRLTAKLYIAYAPLIVLGTIEAGAHSFVVHMLIVLSRNNNTTGGRSVDGCILIVDGPARPQEGKVCLWMQHSGFNGPAEYKTAGGQSVDRTMAAGGPRQDGGQKLLSPR